eukprot:UN05063
MALGATRVVTYKDLTKKGSVQQTKEIRGLDSFNKTAVWEVITSKPQVSYTSARYSVQLHEITMTKQTLAVFTTVYSNESR